MAPTPAAREAGGWSGAAPPAWALATLLCVAASLALRAYSFPLSVIDWDETVYVITATSWLEAAERIAGIRRSGSTTASSMDLERT